MADDEVFRNANGSASTLRYIDVGGGVKAAQSMVATAPYIVDKFTTLAVSTASTNLSGVSGGIPAASQSVFIYVPAGGGSVLFTDDGLTAPTTSIGLMIPAGDAAEITVRPLSNLKFISTSGTVTISLSFRHFAAS